MTNKPIRRVDTPQITPATLRESFERYNRIIFDGRLPVPRFRLSKARTRLGQMACKRKVSRGRTVYYDFCISLSIYYPLTQDQADDILIHEMIHYSIAYTGMKDTSPHGILFRGMMDNINRRFGRHITISVNTRSLRPRQAEKPKTYLVLALTTKDNRHYLSSVNPGAAGKLELSLAHTREILSHGWYQSQDEYFRNMPQVRSLRGRRVSAGFFHEITAKMRRI